MTEKSEDQVIWICEQCNEVFFHFIPEPMPHNKIYKVSCKGSVAGWIPHSKYLALKSDLAERLRKQILFMVNKDLMFDRIHQTRLADYFSEALGKIGGGK